MVSTITSGTSGNTKAVKRYQIILLASILLNIAVGIFLLLAPNVFTGLLDQPVASPDTWPRHWGAQLLAINGLYMPGYWDPQGARWPNWLGIAIRLSFAIFFFAQGDGFVPMGIYDGLSGLLLLLTYLPVVRQGRPS